MNIKELKPKLEENWVKMLEEKDNEWVTVFEGKAALIPSKYYSKTVYRSGRTYDKNEFDPQTIDAMDAEVPAMRELYDRDYELVMTKILIR